MSSIWKSKPFWAFASVSSAIAGAVAYDRYCAKQLLDEFTAEAQKFGEEPLLENQQSQSISLFVLAKDSDASDALRAHFKRYALQLLTIAGVDYVWAVNVDPEKVTKAWNQVAQEANSPEQMLDEGRQIEPETIHQQFLKNELLQRMGKQVTLSDGLWERVKEKLVPKKSWSPHFVALNKSTLSSLSDCLTEIRRRETEAGPEFREETPKKRSWFSWSRNGPAAPSVKARLLTLDDVSLELLDCERSLSLKDRAWRHLFGQTELVRSIGGSTLSLIRKLNSSATGQQ